MTSDEITAQYEKDEDDKISAAAKKEQNKLAHEQKKNSKSYFTQH